jgi:Holliday junction resolvase RusA-like endonuclease
VKISPTHPLAARATSATKKAKIVERLKQLPPAELELEAWDAPAVIPQEQILPAQLGPTYLVLPYPPGVNSLYGHRVMQVRGRAMAVPYKTHEHREYMEQASAATLLAVPWPKDVELAVRVVLFRPRRIGDIDGPIKTLFDALNGRVWVDDSQITDLHVTRRDDKANPRVEVSIQPVAPTEE